MAASAASLEMNIKTPPTHYTVVWGKPDEPDRELGPGEFRRDGRILSTPSYGGESARATILSKAKLAPPAHDDRARGGGHRGEPTVIGRRSLIRRCRHRSPPPSVTSASGSTPGSAIASSPIRSPPVCSVVSRSSRGRIGRRCRTARRERAFIGPVTPNGGLSGKRRRGRRWGSRAEPFRSERSRRMRGADVARVARSPPPPPLVAHLYAPYAPPPRSCVGTPSTMIAAGKLIEREASPAPSGGDVRKCRRAARRSPRQRRSASPRSAPSRCAGPVYEDKSAFLLPDSDGQCRRASSGKRYPGPRRVVLGYGVPSLWT